MDPDQTLNELRTLCGQIRTESPPYDPTTVQRIAELVDSIDEWMHKGGFMPADWAVNRRSVSLVDTLSQVTALRRRST